MNRKSKRKLGIISCIASRNLWKKCYHATLTGDLQLTMSFITNITWFIFNSILQLYIHTININNNLHRPFQTF